MYEYFIQRFDGHEKLALLEGLGRRGNNGDKVDGRDAE